MCKFLGYLNMIGGQIKSARVLSSLFAKELKNERKNKRNSELDMFNRIIQEADEIYEKRYEKNNVSAKHFDEKNFNVDDVIMEGVKTEMKGVVSGITGGADIGDMVENIFEGGAMNGGALEETVVEDTVQKQSNSESSDSESDSESSSDIIADIPEGSADILNIIESEDVITGGSKIIENILEDETEEKNPTTDILERNNKDRDAIADILEHNDPVLDIMEKTIEELNNPVEDILERDDGSKRVPVEDILERDDDSESSENETRLNRTRLHGEFYSDYSDSDSDETEIITAPKYLELIQAIRRTRNQMHMKGGDKNKSVKVIDAFPWIMDVSDDDSD